MNTLESYSGAILGKEDVCAKFVIDDVSSPFVLKGIAKVGERYTFSFWVKSESAGSVTAYAKTFTSTTNWAKCEATFSANTTDIPIAFGTVGTYYIYQPQLEVGTMATDYTPAPEDMATVKDIDNVNQQLATVTESVAVLDVKADNISASVSQVRTSTEAAIAVVNGQLVSVTESVAALDIKSDNISASVSEIQKNTEESFASVNEQFISVSESVSALDIKSDNISASVSEIRKNTEEAIDSVNGSIETLANEVSAKMTPEAVEIKIKAAMDNGTTKVVTETGFTFDDDGLTVEKSGSEMKTQITEDGMVVYQNDEAVLTANNNGVDARNLHATTYLIVGGRSRFENYGDNRTGCFWIGG